MGKKVKTNISRSPPQCLEVAMNCVPYHLVLMNVV